MMAPVSARRDVAGTVRDAPQWRAPGRYASAPLTSTHSIPSENAIGFSNVAVSRTVIASKTVMSANAPGREMCAKRTFIGRC